MILKSKAVPLPKIERIRIFISLSANTSLKLSRWSFCITHCSRSSMHPLLYGLPRYFILSFGNEKFISCVATADHTPMDAHGSMFFNVFFSFEFLCCRHTIRKHFRFNFSGQRCFKSMCVNCSIDMWTMAKIETTNRWQTFAHKNMSRHDCRKQETRRKGFGV